ncbi:hypothetical protein D3C76_850120 [compost metagenome]
MQGQLDLHLALLTLADHVERHGIYFKLQTVLESAGGHGVGGDGQLLFRDPVIGIQILVDGGDLISVVEGLEGLTVVQAQTVLFVLFECGTQHIRDVLIFTEGGMNTSGVDVERSKLLGHRLDNIPSKIHPFDLVELHWDAGYRGTGG